MIVRSEDGSLILIRQTDHAQVSGLFARHWGNETFARLDPYDSVCLAAAEHDRGWMAWESNPRLNPQTGLPRNFLDLPIDEHYRMYVQGIEEVLEEDLYAGLLVSMHLAGIYRSTLARRAPLASLHKENPETEKVEAAVHRLGLQQNDLRERLRKRQPAELDEAHVEANYRLLRFFDLLSLYLCTARVAETTVGPLPTNYLGGETNLVLRPLDDRTVVISPYPFRDSVLEVPVEFRAVPNKRYSGDDEFRQVFERAPAECLLFAFCKEGSK
jgi:hypothetical protein